MSIYIIAEIGINHNGLLDTAREMIRVAKACGVDAVKLQKRTVEAVYTAEELAKPRESVFGHTNGDLKRGLEFGQAEYEKIFTECKRLGLECSASCWDAASVTFMTQFAPPWLKVPSALLTNQPLLFAYAKTGIPVLLSTGMSTWDEIDAAVDQLKFRCFPPTLTLLHCHSSYPSPLDELNLACIRSLQERYGLPVGYSSHSVSPWPCLMAAVYGAEVIEAHLTLSRASWGSDQAASLEPAAFKKMVEEIRTWEIAKGDGVKRVYDSELPVRAKLRR